MGLKVLKIYVENSVIGGYFDKEFAEPTQRLFELFKDGAYIPVISTHVIDEINKGAPEHVKENLQTLKYEKHEISEEMILLAEKYMEQNIVSENYRDDALHIAIATVSDVDVLVSWNFKHIVNLSKIKLFNSVNIREGYNPLEIRTPQEIIIK